MKLFKKKPEDKLKKELLKIRKNIPEQYNQVKLLDELCNNKVDLMFSITTRIIFMLWQN